MANGYFFGVRTLLVTAEVKGDESVVANRQFLRSYRFCLWSDLWPFASGKKIRSRRTGMSGGWQDGYPVILSSHQSVFKTPINLIANIGR
jgi:hypothetical protein